MLGGSVASLECGRADVEVKGCTKTKVKENVEAGALSKTKVEGQALYPKIEFVEKKLLVCTFAANQGLGKSHLRDCLG